jgi:hypothetical protein
MPALDGTVRTFMRPRLPLLPVLLLLAGCPKEPTTPIATPAGKPEPMERSALTAAVTPLSEKAEALLRAQDELVWKYWIDGTPADLAKTYLGTEQWLTPEAIARVGRLRDLAEDSREKRALQHLHAYLAGEWMAQQLSDVSDAVANLEQSLTFNVAGTDRPYRNLESLLASEKSALRRKQMYEAATAAVAKVSTLLERREARAVEVQKQLGLSPEAWLTELREAHPQELRKLAESVLTRTQALWGTVLARLAQRELQLPVERLGRADLPRLVRLQGPDSAFPRTEIVNRTRATLATLQLDPAALKSVTFDATDGPKKNARGLVLGVVVPTDVRISLKPAGGARDQRNALHEFGHAVHDAFTEERRFELAKLGNRTGSEAFAALFQSLAADPTWLDQVAGLRGDAARVWSEAVATQELFIVRRAAGKVLYNLALQRPGVDARSTYREVMTRTYGLPTTANDEARAPLDKDDALGSADYLRGYALAEQFRAQLVRRFGSSWWRQLEAGAFLKPLLAPGNGVTADGLAERIGDGAVRPDALVARLTNILSIATPPVATPTSPGTSLTAASARDAGWEVTPVPLDVDGGVRPPPGPAR